MAKSNINCLILEDAYYTASELCNYIKSLRPDITLRGVVDSLAEAREILYEGNINLIIADTSVSDGETIDFLKKYSPTPIILFSEYDQDFFVTDGMNIVAYIILPVSKEDLNQAFEKLVKFN